MSHSPPVPQGNQSPYPLAEPPHASTADTSSGAQLPMVIHQPEEKPARTGPLPLAAIGAAAGVAVALAGGLFLGLRRGWSKPARGGRRKARA